MKKTAGTVRKSAVWKGGEARREEASGEAGTAIDLGMTLTVYDEAGEERLIEIREGRAPPSRTILKPARSAPRPTEH